MFGLMQDRPLMISSLIEYSALYHGDVEIVSRSIEGPIHRYTYAQAHHRSKQLAQALMAKGVKLGDRVATVAWNSYRHLECYYGVSGMGAILHTINPRLFPEQIAYIANHADDKIILTDLTFVPLLESIVDQLSKVEAFVIMTDREHMPETSLPNTHCYEEILASQNGDFLWPEFNENTASSLCYTSGTTGNPKGVLYSHRSTLLHSFASTNRDVLGLCSSDVVMPVVPMFHVNSWGIAYTAAMCGTKLVLPGMGMDGASLYDLLDSEKVSISAGVPTVWLLLLKYLQENSKKLPYMDRTVIGGSAVPASMIETFEKDYDVTVVHAWGMTEMSPLGTICTMKPKMGNWSYDKRLAVKCKQGRTVYGVDMKITDDQGNELPRDGEAFGHLLVRGPWVTSGYFRGEGGNVVDDKHWFDTGDVATLDSEGYMQITDRAKDVIKSGGEWISSIELENIAIGHPDVAEAAVIGIAHPKWDERPLLIIVRNEGSSTDGPEILDFMKGKIASWWMPDDVTFVEEIPHTATGKIQKLRLREQFSDYILPTA